MGIGEGWKTERKYERREAQRIWENGKKREKNEGREEGKGIWEEWGK